MEELCKVLSQPRHQPLAVIAKTIKGKGIPGTNSSPDALTEEFYPAITIVKYPEDSDFSKKMVYSNSVHSIFLCIAPRAY